MKPPAKRGIPGMVWISFSFIPWMGYWSLVGSGFGGYGILFGFIIAGVLNAYRLYTKNPNLMDVVTLAFFTAASLSYFLFHSPFFIVYSNLSGYAVLSLMAFASIAMKEPFTYQSSKMDYPEEYWREPLFIKTNNILTFVWGGIFFAGAVLNLPLLPKTLWLSTIVPLTLIGLGIVFSIVFPTWYGRRELVKQYLTVKYGGNWQCPGFEIGGSSAEDEYDVIIIGGGIGGLTCAALLAKRGAKVLLAEQHSKVGGHCTSFTRKGFTFDGGVEEISGVHEKGAVTHILRQLEVEDQIEFLRVDSEYIFPDFRIKVPRDIKEYQDKLCQVFPDEAAGIPAFFTEIIGVYNDMYKEVDRTGGIPMPPRDPKQLFDYPRTHPYHYRWMNRTFSGMLDNYFKNERLKKVLSALTGYIGVPPQEALVPTMAPIFGYYLHGGYYPKGGSQVLADTLAKAITRNNGQIRLRSLVDKILIENGEIQGVRLDDGRVYKTRIIVSNANAQKTFLNLVGKEYFDISFVDWVEGLKMSPSAFLVYLGIDFKPDLSPRTFFIPSYEKEEFPRNTGVGISINSFLDPDLAPEGKHCLTVITLAPYEYNWGDRKTKEYKETKQQVADLLIQQAERVIPELSKHIVVRDAATPRTFERLNLNPQGAIYSFDQGKDTIRPHYKTPLEGLYLVGASTFPGAGIEAVVISGAIVANDIIRG